MKQIKQTNKNCDRCGASFKGTKCPVCTLWIILNAFIEKPKEVKKMLKRLIEKGDEQIE
jgi:hypothetical protein